jgi:hypothetical protein
VIDLREFISLEITNYSDALSESERLLSYGKILFGPSKLEGRYATGQKIICKVQRTSEIPHTFTYSRTCLNCVSLNSLVVHNVARMEYMRNTYSIWSKDLNN